MDHARYKDPDRLCSLAETINMNRQLSLIVVDHIGLLRPKGVRSPYEKASESSDIIQSLPKLCNCPLLVLCQLSREYERRVTSRVANKYPQLSDMRDSGKLEENADSVWGLYREDKESEVARLEQLKGRDSGTWSVGLKFDRFIQKFYDGEWVEPAQQYGGAGEDL